MQQIIKKLVKTQNSTHQRQVNSLVKKIPDSTTLIHINQYNADKQHLEKTIENAERKIQDTSGLVTATVLNTKISEVESKIPNSSNLVTTTVLNPIISEVENKILNNSKCITTQKFNKLTTKKFEARLKQTDLVNKTILIIK